MTVQKYKVWPEGSDEEGTATGVFHAGSPEAAAEYYAEEFYDGFATNEMELNVKDEDGCLYGVFVEVSLRPSATGRLS